MYVNICNKCKKITNDHAHITVDDISYAGKCRALIYGDLCSDCFNKIRDSVMAIKDFLGESNEAKDFNDDNEESEEK